jgi:hypothetical protein
MKNIKILLVIGMFAASMPVNAQTKPAIKKYKVPTLYTQLGGLRDSVSIPVSEAENLIGKPLKIFDDKKGLYTISSYQFLYRKRGVTEDEESGKVSPVNTIVSSRFKITPLPETWIIQVREQLKAGEELFFFDVIAKDAQGRVMYAPDLKIMVR